MALMAVRRGIAQATENRRQKTSTVGMLARARFWWRTVKFGDREDTSPCLEGLAELASQRARHHRAAVLLGAAEAFRGVGTPFPLPTVDPAGYRDHVASLRSQLGEEQFARMSKVTFIEVPGIPNVSDGMQTPTCCLPASGRCAWCYMRVVRLQQCIS